MKLNCDLGESFGAWKMGLDSEVIPHIDMANIACGFHAGDPNVISQTLTYTKKNNTEIGAHPSFPDVNGFGRRLMDITGKELVNLLHYQIAALDGMALNQQQSLTYVKPHGALYNQMMAKTSIRQTVMQAIASFYKPLKLMLLATNDSAQHLDEAKNFGVELIFEAFADRRYDDQGRLLSRSESGAVLARAEILAQVRQLTEQATITTNSGKLLQVRADTICVHGDNPESINLVKEIKAICQQSILTPK